MGRIGYTVLIFLIILVRPTTAFDWGDFHVVAVIFFSFFGPCLILGLIIAVLYFACIRSWFERFRDEVRETHRSQHPWPPGSAKWQLQMFVNSGGRLPTTTGKPPALPALGAPAPAPQGQAPSQQQPQFTQTTLPVPQSGLPYVSQNMAPPQISPGYLQSPMPKGYNYQSHQVEQRSFSQPPSIIIPIETMNGIPYPAGALTPQAYSVMSPQQERQGGYLLSPSYTLVEKGQAEEVHKKIVPLMDQQVALNQGRPIPPLEAITVRTTTTTRRTTVLSPVGRPYTIIQ